MAKIQSFGPIAQLKSEASSHVFRYRAGRLAQSGRGLAFWFLRVERYELVAGMPYQPVRERAAGVKQFADK